MEKRAIESPRRWARRLEEGDEVVEAETDGDVGRPAQARQGGGEESVPGDRRGWFKMGGESDVAALEPC